MRVWIMSLNYGININTKYWWQICTVVPLYSQEVGTTWTSLKWSKAPTILSPQCSVWPLWVFFFLCSLGVHVSDVTLHHLYLLLSVNTTTPLAASQLSHHSQGFRQITGESDPLQSIMALRRVLRERCGLWLHRSSFVQLSATSCSPLRPTKILIATLISHSKYHTMCMLSNRKKYFNSI